MSKRTRPRPPCRFCGRRNCKRCYRAPRDEASELARIDAFLEAERRGKALPVPGLSLRLPDDVQLPTEPLRQIIRPMIQRDGMPAVAGWLGLSERRLREALAGKTLDRLRAERLVIRLGLNEHEVYPDGERTKPLPEPEPELRRRSEPTECADPYCSKRRAPGRRFCPRHAARLDKIRAAMKSHKFARPHEDDLDVAA